MKILSKVDKEIIYYHQSRLFSCKLFVCFMCVALVGRFFFTPSQRHMPNSMRMIRHSAGSCDFLLVTTFLLASIFSKSPPLMRV